MTEPSTTPAAAEESPRRPWEALDDLHEYHQLCRSRIEHLVEVREPLVLISQVQRSGGSLLSRLFDGHPECHAHPYELKIGPGHRDRWPELPLDQPETWFTTLFEKKARTHLKKGYSKPGRGDTDAEVFPFVFFPRLQKRIFDACLAARPIERERDVLDCYMTSYFNAWLDNQNLYPAPKKAITGFMPSLTSRLGNLARYFTAYPDGLLLSIVRDPRSWYASASRHKPHYKKVARAIDYWRGSTQGALDAQARFGDRVLLVTYAQLVRETEPTMSSLAQRMGIEMSPALLTPTFNGRPVRANSSDPGAAYGVLADRIDAYRELLDTETIAEIDELAGDLYDVACERCVRPQPGRA